MATYPLATLAAQITEEGVSAPSYEDVFASLQASFRLIYGEDAYLEPDSQDGQLLAIFARAIHDCNQATIAAYNSFSPATAVGAGLSNVVRINHMKRLIPTKSQINLTITGVAGTIITDGIVGDTDGNRWLVPSPTIIPVAGTITVTAEAEVDGAISAPIGTATQILTPVAGWQTVTNETSATPGNPVESDAALRARQEITPALNAYTVLIGLVAAIKALPGVTYGTAYENDTAVTDSNGIPGHSIALVVKGGVAADIAQTIYERKAPGVGTHGTTTITINDISGAERDIKFFIPAEIGIKAQVSIQPGTNYTSAIGDQIKQAVADFINEFSIGEDLVVNRLYTPALLLGSLESETYKITALTAAKLADSLATTDIAIAFTEKAICDPDDVDINLV